MKNTQKGLTNLNYSIDGFWKEETTRDTTRNVFGDR